MYVGYTSNLSRRVYEHKQFLLDGFTKKYKITKLVYYDIFDSPELMIKREKRLKKYRRIEKIRLVERLNPDWEDLYDRVD